jgi:hypothetical protein
MQRMAQAAVDSAASIAPQHMAPSDARLPTRSMLPGPPKAPICRLGTQVCISGVTTCVSPKGTHVMRLGTATLHTALHVGETTPSTATTVLHLSANTRVDAPGHCDAAACTSVRAHAHTRCCMLCGPPPPGTHPRPPPTHTHTHTHTTAPGLYLSAYMQVHAGVCRCVGLHVSRRLVSAMTRCPQTRKHTRTGPRIRSHEQTPPHHRHPGPCLTNHTGTSRASSCPAHGFVLPPHDATQLSVHVTTRQQCPISHQMTPPSCLCIS